MFGYVLPVRGEMRVKDFERYRAAYCGLCKQLGKGYGVFSRLLLNYDLVLVAVVADALSGESGCIRCEGCFANPLARRQTLHETEGLALAADGLVMLSWHKLADNLADERWYKRALYGMAYPFLKAMYRRAAAKQPQLAEVLTAQMARQRDIEDAGCYNVDEACEPTAKMCEAVFQLAGRTESEQRVLGRLGLFAGQIVYLLDAAEDFEADQKHGRYNVFVKMGLSYEQAVEAARTRCRMAAGEIALCYSLLDIRQNRDILDNIFYLGLPQGINLAGTKRSKKGRQGHGQIESV